MLRSWTALLILVAAFGIGVPPAANALPVRPQCGDFVNCPTTVSATAASAATSVAPLRKATTSTNPASPARECRERIGTGSDTQVVDCSFQGGWWVDAHQCYVKAMMPQPDKVDLRWDGHATGAIYMCVALGADDRYLTTYFWAATQPPEIPNADPAALARQAVAALNLQPIRIGMVPEDRPGYVGIVGMPVWMWVDRPDARTYGPASNSATDGSVSVTIQAKVSRSVWEMGDGHVVTCTTAGTVYEDRFGKNMSPDCGYRYSRQGTYTVRATTTWDIAWTANTGQSGTIPLTLTATRTVVIGEVQVITTGG